MKTLTDSRNSQIDTELCVSQARGRYDLIIIAAERLRELRRQHRENPNRYITAIDALLDVQNGQVDPQEYLSRVRARSK